MSDHFQVGVSFGEVDETAGELSEDYFSQQPCWPLSVESMVTNRHPLSQAELIIVISKERILKSARAPPREPLQVSLTKDNGAKSSLYKTVSLSAGRQILGEIIDY